MGLTYRLRRPKPTTPAPGEAAPPLPVEPVEQVAPAPVSIPEPVVPVPEPRVEDSAAPSAVLRTPEIPVETPASAPAPTNTYSGRLALPMEERLGISPIRPKEKPRSAPPAAKPSQSQTAAARRKPQRSPVDSPWQTFALTSPGMHVPAGFLKDEDGEYLQPRVGRRSVYSVPALLLGLACTLGGALFIHDDVARALGNSFQFIQVGLGYRGALAGVILFLVGVVTLFTSRAARWFVVKPGVTGGDHDRVWIEGKGVQRRDVWAFLRQVFIWSASFFAAAAVVAATALRLSIAPLLSGLFVGVPALAATSILLQALFRRRRYE